MVLVATVQVEFNGLTSGKIFKNQSHFIYISAEHSYFTPFCLLFQISLVASYVPGSIFTTVDVRYLRNKTMCQPVGEEHKSLQLNSQRRLLSLTPCFRFFYTQGQNSLWLRFQQKTKRYNPVNSAANIQAQKLCILHLCNCAVPAEIWSCQREKSSETIEFVSWLRESTCYTVK